MVASPLTLSGVALLRLPSRRLPSSTCCLLTRQAQAAIRVRSARPSYSTSTPSAPARRKSSWGGAVVRVGLAAAAVYWYSTSTVFADEPDARTTGHHSTIGDINLQTVDAVIEEKRRTLDANHPKPPVESGAPAEPTAGTISSQPELAPNSPYSLPNDAASVNVGSADTESNWSGDGEAAAKGAFNPETGEINWDCPCLGGMAHGPCGEPFKAAFTCFVFSKDEPKGMDCIDQFEQMQKCFQEHPDIYGPEPSDEEIEQEAVAGDNAVNVTSHQQSSGSISAPTDTSEGGPAVASAEPDSHPALQNNTSQIAQGHANQHPQSDRDTPSELSASPISSSSAAPVARLTAGADHETAKTGVEGPATHPHQGDKLPARSSEARLEDQPYRFAK